MTTQKIDTPNLLKLAQASEDREAYQLVAKTGRYRVGVGTRLAIHTQASVFFVEIVVYMCPACTKADLTFLQHALNSLKMLEKNGYMLTCQDDNSILCEKLSTEKTLPNELESAIELIENELEKTT
jgi:hypothetical protein